MRWLKSIKLHLDLLMIAHTFTGTLCALKHLQVYAVKTPSDDVGHQRWAYALVHFDQAASRPEPSPATIASTFTGTLCASESLKIYAVNTQHSDGRRAEPTTHLCVGQRRSSCASASPGTIVPTSAQTLGACAPVKVATDEVLKRKRIWARSIRPSAHSPPPKQ
jgi:hypothetical protein